jgi:hypothetical protein
LWGLYILKSSQLLSWSHFCLQQLQHLLTFMFLVYFHGLWLLLGIVLSVHTCCFHNMVILSVRLVFTDFGTFIIFLLLLLFLHAINKTVKITAQI